MIQNIYEVLHWIEDNAEQYHFDLNHVEDQENELYHVFNVEHPEWEESIQANSDIVDFFSIK